MFRVYVLKKGVKLISGMVKKIDFDIVEMWYVCKNNDFFFDCEKY